MFRLFKEETKMKYLILTLALISLSAMGETVINYEDGSTYTLGANEEIFVSTAPLFKQSVFDSGKKTLYTKQVPWPKRDYVPTPSDGLTVGSHEWCAAYVPWSEGLTFGMVAWQRYCDTNNDGVYDENDEPWEG